MISKLKYQFFNANTNKAESRYKSGTWFWDEKIKNIAFQSKLPPPKLERKLSGTSKRPMGGTEVQKQLETDIKFIETCDTRDMIRFKRYFQRREDIGDDMMTNLVTLQDVKDVVLFLALSYNSRQLSVEFIRFFHTRTVDRFLRALIVYFQYYIQLWEQLLLRREEAKRKLRSPETKKFEALMRDNLSDLRSVVAREYAAIILGTEEMRRFHHLGQSEMSAGYKDRRLMEVLTKMAARVVWVALYRKNIFIIEHELNRLLRGEIFNLVDKRARISVDVSKSQTEKLMFDGATNLKERMLSQRSPVIKEKLHGHHDFRLLGTGISNFEPGNDRRLQYLQFAFSCTDEALYHVGVPVGILGLSKTMFDTVLVYKARSRAAQGREIQKFIIPPKQEIEVVPTEYPKGKCPLHPSPSTIKLKRGQSTVWRKYVQADRTVEQKQDNFSVYDTETTAEEESSQSEEILEEEELT